MRIQVLFAGLACVIEIAEPQTGARGEDWPVLDDFVVMATLRAGIVGQRSFDVDGLSVLHADETLRDHEASAVGYR